MKILVTGANGQLGHDVCNTLQKQSVPYWGVSSRELDITDAAAVERLLHAYRPYAVIHCAAWTSVDAAQEHETKVMAVNAQGTRNLALGCKALDCKLLYLSTDYVFSGEKVGPYSPMDAAKPLNVYGQSKLAGEQAVLECLSRYFIVRSSWMFGIHGKNFVESMLRTGDIQKEINVVDDQIGAPTYTKDLAKLLCDMINTDQYGVYHAANQGSCSWAEFAREIFRQSKMAVRVHPVKASDYRAKAFRPMNSILEMSNLEKAGFSLLPPWQDALSRYLQERVKRS